MAVVGEHPLPVGLLRQLGRRGGRARAAARAAAAPPPGTLSGARRQRRAARAARAARRRSRRTRPTRRAPPARRRRAGARLRKIAHASAYGCAARRPRLGLVGADRADVAEPDPDRPVLDRALRSAAVHVRRAHLDPAPLRVAHERRRRVEAHRLRVQQRAEELARVVVPQPRRLVGEQPERGRVRLREAEAGEADELVVEHVSPSRSSTPLPERPSTKRAPERLDRLLAALAAHRAPQPLGLADAEARRAPSPRRAPGPGRRRRRASRAAAREQRVVDRRRRSSGSSRRRLAALDVRVDGLALDRPRPDERDLHREVVEVLRPRAQQRSASARGSRSGRRRRCRPPGSRRTRPGRRAGRARGRSARRAGARSRRRTPRRPTASRARAGRS